MKICGIYCIEAVTGNPKRIGQKYIGQSIDCNYRIRKHLESLNSKSHYNRKLQRYFNKYGSDSLKAYILTKCQKEELDSNEKSLIESFDSIRHGFNCMEGGIRPPSNKKAVTLENIFTGQQRNFDSISDFCSENGCSTGHTSDVVSGKLHQVKGWFSPKNTWRPKKYEVVSPSGEKHTILQIAEFCRQQHIPNKHNFLTMLQGKRVSSCGWKLVNGRTPNDPNSNRRIKIKLINDDGVIYEGESINKSANDLKLQQPNLWKLAHGFRKTCGGWRLYKEEIL